LVIRKALKFLDKKRLDGMDIYCSLEPCVMCTSAIALSQIRNIYFCAEDKASGGLINGPKLGFSKYLKYKFSFTMVLKKINFQKY